jgi:hypothetical protein
VLKSADPAGSSPPLNRMSLLRELWEFLRVRKKFWLLPIIIIMLMFGVLLLVAESSAVAPFIYTLF